MDIAEQIIGNHPKRIVNYPKQDKHRIAIKNSAGKFGKYVKQYYKYQKNDMVTSQANDKAIPSQIEKYEATENEPIYFV